MQKKIHPLLVVLFIASCVAELYSQACEKPALEYLAKPLIMTTIILSFSSLVNIKHILYWPTMAAFFFSLAGDVLLMFTKHNEIFFLSGLATFLLAHVFYIVTFSVNVKKSKNHRSVFGPGHYVILILAVSLYTVLFPHLAGFMKIAVLLYTAAITAMVLTALQRKAVADRGSYQLVLWGALLFLLSDSLLAINRFWFEIPFGGIWVMASYMPAQYLIFLGLLKQCKTD